MIRVWEQIVLMLPVLANVRGALVSVNANANVNANVSVRDVPANAKAEIGRASCRERV